MGHPDSRAGLVVAMDQEGQEVDLVDSRLADILLETQVVLGAAMVQVVEDLADSHHIEHLRSCQVVPEACHTMVAPDHNQHWVVDTSWEVARFDSRLRSVGWGSNDLLASLAESCCLRCRDSDSQTGEIEARNLGSLAVVKLQDMMPTG